MAPAFLLVTPSFILLHSTSQIAALGTQGNLVTDALGTGKTILCMVKCQIMVTF